MADYEALQQKKNQLIRKGLEGSVFKGNLDAAEVSDTTLFDASGELIMPDGYSDLGWLDEKGASFGRKVDTSDVKSWGSNEPTRSDITADTTTLKLGCQETNANTIGLYTGVDTSKIVPSANGSVFIKKPAVTTPMYYRLFTLSVDLGDAGEIYIVRTLPRAMVTDYDDQEFNNSDDPTMWSVTFTGFKDAKLRYAEAYLFGGPGWFALLEDMGFAKPAAPAKAAAAKAS